MKKIVSSVLAASMIVSSCSGVQGKGSNQQPMPSKKASSVAVQTVQSKIDAGQADAATDAGVQVKPNATTALLNSAVDSLMRSGDLHIRDYNGNSVSSEEYKLNPAQYYLIYKKDQNANSYQALNTSIVNQQGSNDFTINYKIYSNIVSPETFQGASLSAPAVTDSVLLSASPLALMQNKDAINALMKRLSSSAQLAGTKNPVTDFLFPTAYGESSYRDKLMITAIVFSSVAVLSYLFAWYRFGTLNAAIGLTFWLLFWFNDDEE